MCWFAAIALLPVLQRQRLYEKSKRPDAGNDSGDDLSELDVDVLMRHIEHLPLRAASLGDEYFYSSLPLCVVDSVYSIGVRYTSTKRVVAHYCTYASLRRLRRDHSRLPSWEEQQSISQFVELMTGCGIDFLTARVFANRQRTSTRSGILKSEAVLRFASVLQRFGVEQFEDMSDVVSIAGVADAIQAIPGQGSGVSLRYFQMLAGSDEFVKPDRWIMRFVARALRRPVTSSEAERLVCRAAEGLRPRFADLTPRLLDHEIWKFERAR